MQPEEDSVRALYRNIQKHTAGYSREDIALKMAEKVLEWTKGMIGNADQAALVLARQYHAQTLISGQTGRKPAKDFDGITSFWVGNATQCVAAGVIHPDVGIGGAHFKTVKQGNYEQAYLRLLQSSEDEFVQGVRLMNSLSHRALVHFLVDMDSRSGSIDDVLLAAVSEFKRLLPLRHDSLPHGTHIVVSGMEYCTTDEASLLNTYTQHLVAEQFGEHVQVNPCLGQAGGVIYGGPNHVQFSIPHVMGMG